VFRALEPLAGKLARAVLRGERRRKPPDLPDVIASKSWQRRRCGPFTASKKKKKKENQPANQTQKPKEPNFTNTKKERKNVKKR